MMEVTALVIGTVLILLVVFQVGLHIFSAMQVTAREREIQKINQMLWWEQIERAKHLRMQPQTDAPAWNGFRKFVVDRKEMEANDICSFYLVPHDGKSLPEFLPGQFLTFRVNTQPTSAPILRCYSLSDAPAEDHYRVSIKRVHPPSDMTDAPPGQVSNWFHDEVEVGDILDVKAPAGRFVLDTLKQKAVVLIAGGIGVTPFLSMLLTTAQKGWNRNIHLFYSVHQSTDLVQLKVLQKLAEENELLHLYCCFSRPSESDLSSKTFDHHGRVTIDLLKSKLPSNNFEFFLCGPNQMQSELEQALKDWGVPKQDIHKEAFNKKTVKATTSAEQQQQAAEVATACKIVFEKSQKEFAWNPQMTNLLEFAIEQGVEIEHSCQAGACGSCLVAIKSGQVVYDQEPECEIEEGCCLACVGRPKGDLILDA